MAKKILSKQINLVNEGGAFLTFFKKMGGEKKDYGFEDISTLRTLFSNEKSRLLHIIKSKKPTSIYLLAKMLGRDFKSVSDDIKLLEKFGFLDLIMEKTGKRKRLKPVAIIDVLKIEIVL
jgi:predicted transcriptional regulator